jgi:hypothetical protein
MKQPDKSMKSTDAVVANGHRRTKAGLVVCTCKTRGETNAAQRFACRTIHALRTDRWKYIHPYGLWDVDELYDLQADRAKPKTSSMIRRISKPSLRSTGNSSTRWKRQAECICRCIVIAVVR